MGSLVAVVFGFASGVFLRSVFDSGWPVVIFVLLLAALFSAAAFLKSRPLYVCGGIFCLCAALGMIRALAAEVPLPDAFARDLKHRVSYEGVVAADPDVRDASQRVAIRVTSGEETVKMLAVAPREPVVAVGDTVRVSGTLAVPEPFATDGGRIFRYDKYLERDGIRFLLNFAYLRVVEEAPWYSFPAALARMKHSFLNGIAATLPEPYASLAGGITIGGKSGLGNDLKDAFTRSSLVHIIVLSGYNVMVVAEWVMAALAFTKLPKRWTAAAGAGALLVFVGIAGATATAIRAALMAVIALYARATGRSYAAGRALILVILLMLIWNPLYLVFDPGFGLSMAATAGLIWLAPIIERVWDTVSHSPDKGLAMSKHGFWKNVVATTLAAQAAVLPLLLYNTGNLSVVALPTNLLAVPVVPVAMGLSALAGFAGMIFGSTALTAGGALAPLLGIVLAFPAYAANAYLIFIAQASAALPFAAFTLPAFPFWLVLAAYAALIFFASSKRFSITLQLP